MNSNLRTKATLQQRVGSLITGTQKHFPTGQLTVGGVTYESATLVQTLQGLGNSIAGADAAKAKWNDALKDMQDQEAKVGPVVRASPELLALVVRQRPVHARRFRTRAPLGARAPDRRAKGRGSCKAHGDTRREAHARFGAEKGRQGQRHRRCRDSGNFAPQPSAASPTAAPPRALA